MAVTAEQIEEFREFALAKLQNGGVDSLEECLQQWREEFEYSETVASVRRGVEDIEAGRCHSLEEVDAEIRRRFEARR